MPRRELDIPSLDGLRAVSIGLVFGAHAGWPDLIPGGLGVTVFFVLSGYLITTLLRLQWERTRSLDLRGFYLRRAFRILPLSYLVLTVVLIGNLAGVLGSGEVHLWPTVAQYLQATNLYAVFVHEQPMMDGTGVYWSLSIEEHFYLVLPVALLAMSRAGWDRRRQARSMLVLCAVVLAWRFVLVYAMHAPIDRTYYGTDTRLDSLLLGCVAALVANPVLDRDIVHEARTRLAAHLGLVTIVATLLVRDDGFRETLRYTIQSVAIVAIVRWVVYAPRTWMSRPLNTRPAIWLGQLSYGFYLVHHMVVFEASAHLGGRLPAAAVALAVSILLAWGLHRVVDPRAYRARDELLARGRRERRPRPPPAQPAAA